GSSTPVLLLIPLHGAGIAGRRLPGITAGIPECPALSQQVPTPVELNLHRAQALLVALESIGIRAVCLLAPAQVLLLRHQSLDPASNGLVAHRTDTTPWAKVIGSTGYELAS